MTERNCRFRNEIESDAGEWFKYSPDLCEYQLAIQEAEKKFECVPWDIPYRFENGKTKICVKEDGQRFEEALQNASKQERSGELCQMDACDQTFYGIRVQALFIYVFMTKHPLQFRQLLIVLMYKWPVKIKLFSPTYK